jgi:prepilin-type N-terminal cleavage/methylation domain-containing protein
VFQTNFKIMEKENKNFKASSGFTLLETLVAVAILMISISSAFSLAPEGLAGSRFAKNQTTATYLAQEALEIVRSNRDNKMIHSQDTADPLNWLAKVSQCIDELCTVNPINLDMDQCSGSCPPVRTLLDTVNDSLIYGNGQYFESAQNSIFTRTVTIKKVLNKTIGPTRDDTEIKVTVRVTWKEGVISKNTEVSEYLFDWATWNK